MTRSTRSTDLEAKVLTTLLDLLGIALLVAFAALVWWPAALLVAGIACLLLSWRLTR